MVEIPILLLILLAATAGCVVGRLIARDGPSSTRKPEVTIAYFPASITGLVLEIARRETPIHLLTCASEWLHAEYGIPLVVTYRYDPATNALVTPMISGADISEPPLSIRLGAGLLGEVARNRRSLLVEHVPQETRLGLTVDGMEAAYIVPLVHETMLLGVLCLQSDNPAYFSKAECAILDQIAALIASLTAVSVRLENSQQAILRFDRFQTVAQRLAERLDSQHLLQEIVEAAREMLDTQMSVLLDIDLDSGELRPLAWSGITEETAALMKSRYKEDLKGIVAWGKRPARTPDLHTDQRTALATEAVAAGMVSELAVPVLHFERLYGVLAVETNVHRHFTDEESDLLSSLAAHAGLALRNAQLFERVQQTNCELEKTVADLTISRQQAENARISAVEANRLKTEFVNNMNHELRTPLNAVINFTRIVMDGHAGSVNEQQVQYLGFVHDSGKHLLGLINDILDLAKIEAGKMELRRAPTDLEAILRGVMSTAVGLTRDKGLKLRLELSPGLPRMNIDETRIRQVLLNLLSNAAKFTDQGEITLRAECREGQVIVSVQDTGIGIKPEDLPKVFEEFRQIDGSLQRQETGTGLGMPISQRFVQLHGGAMWIESEVGAGTTVTFNLPVEEPVATLQS